MADQVHLVAVVGEDRGHRQNVGGELIERVTSPAWSRARFVLAAQVDGGDGSPGGRERFEDGEEVFLAAVVAGNEQRGLALPDASGRIGSQRGERATGGADLSTSNAGGQVQRSRGAHSASFRALGALCGGFRA